MSMDSEVGLWKQATSWLWALLLPLILTVWSMLNGRINEIKAKADAALPRKEFEDARAESRLERDRLRGDVKELFTKQEANKDLLNQRVESVRESVERKIDDLRRDVNGGFTSLRDELRNMKHN